MFEIIARPMGIVIKFIYDNFAFQNYGITIVFFTLFIKSILLPLTVKQQLSSEKIQAYQPKINKIQENYKDNPEKMNIEIQKFYKENGINPMSGCLPMLIQLPFMFSLYYAISQPLKYVAGKSAETIELLFSMIPADAGDISRLKDMSIISYFSNNPSALERTNGLLTSSDLFNMNFLGISLCDAPSSMFSNWFNPDITGTNILLLLVPLLAAGTSYLAMKIATSKQEKPKEDDMQTAMQSSMAMISPIMSGVITFTLPAGLGLYWIIGNIFQLGQQLFINKFFLKKNEDKNLTITPPYLVKDDTEIID